MRNFIRPATKRRRKMVLYKKVFPLATGISFFQYITALRKAYFPNFVLTIDKLPPTENYRGQIFFTAPLWRWGLANAFLEGVLLKECRIQYSEGESHFTIQASAKTVNLFLASFYVIGAILLFIFALFMITTKNTWSFNNIFTLAIITILFSSPSILIYFRDKEFWDKVGSLGREIEGKQNII